MNETLPATEIWTREQWTLKTVFHRLETVPLSRDEDKVNIPTITFEQTIQNAFPRQLVDVKVMSTTWKLTPQILLSILSQCEQER